MTHQSPMITIYRDPSWWYADYIDHPVGAKVRAICGVTHVALQFSAHASVETVVAHQRQSFPGARVRSLCCSVEQHN